MLRVRMTGFQIFFYCALALSVGVAAVRGGRPEWIVAIACLLASIASPLLQQGLFEQPEYGIMIVDVSLLVALGAVALTSNRFWPLWAMGFHIVGTTIHLARIVQPTVWPWAYAVAEVFWSYPVLLALLIGSWRARDFDEPLPPRTVPAQAMWHG